MKNVSVKMGPVQFYEQLIARGKKKKVALTALMRKIIVIANARLKELDTTAH